MTADRLLDLLALLALACVGITGLARAIALAARGVWVLPIDRERSLSQGLADLTFLLVLLTWFYEAIVTTVAPDCSARGSSTGFPIRSTSRARPVATW